MNKSQKLSLKNSANVIYNGNGYVNLASVDDMEYSEQSVDYKGRTLVSLFLARRAICTLVRYKGSSPEFDLITKQGAQDIVVDELGLTYEQVAKLERVAASDHCLYRRAERVANFLRKVVDIPGYMGRG